MTSRVFVEPGRAIALDRPSLAAPAPYTRSRLLSYCEQWAAEVGWTLAAGADEADAVVVGPGVEAQPGAVRVLPGQGVDGFRWGIRSRAFRSQWPVETLRYGPTRDHVVDVRRPERERRGVAALLHGGFWMDAWRRDLMDGIAVDLVRRGWETWNIEYRRVGAGGGWPQTGDDAVAAIGAVCAGSGVDEVVLVGHSAGGHLALHAAARRPASVATVVSLAGLCDLQEAERHGVGGGAVRRLLGDAPAAAASPVEQVPLRAHVVVAHCAGDFVVPIEQSRRYARAAQAAGGDVELLALDGGNHMSLIEPENAWGEVAPHIFTPPP